MKKYLILLLTILLISCDNIKTQQGDFINTDCNIPNFKLINQIETQFSGIGGVSTQISDIVGTYTSLGYITFVEQNLSAVTKSLSQYNVVGLIGSDFLKSHNFIVDYKMRKIYPYEQLDSIYGKSYN